MRVTDLTPQFIKYVLESKNTSQYLTQHKVLDHYFTFWAGNATFPPEILRSEIEHNRSLVLKSLNRIEKLFGERVSSLDSIRIVLMVGAHTSNGHAMLDGETPVVWIPVEWYQTECSADVFVTHEIAHALHYQASPEFYFKNKAEKDNTARQLLTEGIATYLTAEVLDIEENIALWGDFLSPRESASWIQACQEQLPDLSRYLLQHLVDSDTGMFLLDDPTDLKRYRAGYYVGLCIMREITRQSSLPPRQLLAVPRQQMEQTAREVLLNMASKD